ncbi:hypothetical protein FD755_004438, partial [Muntiacus reevesi]
LGILHPAGPWLRLPGPWGQQAQLCSLATEARWVPGAVPGGVPGGVFFPGNVHEICTCPGKTDDD